MNRKQLTIILVAGLLIAGLGVLTMKRDNAAWQSAGQNAGRKLLGDFAANDVAQVRIQSATNELNLVRKDDVWTVKERGNYPANFADLGELVRKLVDLKVVQSMQVGPSQLPRLELLAPDKGAGGGTLVELKDASGKVLKSVLLGKKHMKQGAEDSQFGGGGFPDGRFVLVSGQPDVALISDPLDRADPKPETWVNKDFVKVEKLKSVAVTHAIPSNSFKLFRDAENGELKLADAKPEEKLDAGKASALGGILGFPSFNDVLAADAKPETTGMDKPLQASVETFDGFKYDFKVGGKTNDENLYLSFTVNADLPTARTPGKDEKPEDKDKLDKEFKEKNEKLKEKLAKEKSLEKWVYQVSKWTVDAFFKERAQLFADKKDEANKEGGAGPVPPIPGAPEFPIK